MAGSHQNRFGKYLKGASGPIIGTTLSIGTSMAMGYGFRDAVVTNIGTSIGWMAAPQAMGAKMAYDIVPSLVEAGYQSYRWAQAEWGMSFWANMGGEGFQDTQGAATMRQRAVQAIHDSKMNARSVLGQEASLLHQGKATPPQMRNLRTGW